MTNALYYGDNLACMRKFHDQSVELIYLDSHFNFNTRHNLTTADGPVSRHNPAIRPRQTQIHLCVAGGRPWSWWKFRR